MRLCLKGSQLVFDHRKQMSDGPDVLFPSEMKGDAIGFKTRAHPQIVGRYRTDLRDEKQRSNAFADTI